MEKGGPLLNLFIKKENRVGHYKGDGKKKGISAMQWERGPRKRINNQGRVNNDGKII